MKAPELRTQFNYDPAKVSQDTATIRTGHDAKGEITRSYDQGESMTIQSMAEDADINVLMDRYGITGKFPENPRVPTYQQFEDVFDFRTAMEQINLAQEMFMEYPAHVRARFENDPQKLLEFVADDKNREEAEFLKLVKPKETQHVAGSNTAPGVPGAPAGGNPGPNQGSAQSGQGGASGPGGPPPGGPPSTAPKAP